MPSQVGRRRPRPAAVDGAHFDADGNLIIPAAALAQTGIGGQDALRCELVDGVLHIAADALRKVYVEVTSLCNLNCATCIRHAWAEPMGHMPLARFRQLLAGLPPAAPEALTLAFGGFGEPLAHPDFLELVRLARGQRLRVEITTNGLLLNAQVIRELVALGVSQVAVSVDGADEMSYGSVRGSNLAPVLTGVAALHTARRRARVRLSLGLAFVAMRRNIASLPELLRLATDLQLDFVTVSNLVPHTPEMAGEALWGRAAWAANFQPHTWRPRLTLGRMDVDDATRAVLAAIWSRAPVAPPPALDPGTWRNFCRFVHEGVTVVGWDGRVAPCLSLLHAHPEYVYGHWKQVRSYIVGQVDEQPLAAIWAAPAYADFRQRMRLFDLPECFVCGGCPSTETNAEDCYGTPFPVCSECLWAQGIVLCP